MLRIVDTPLLWATFFLRCVPSVYRACSLSVDSPVGCSFGCGAAFIPLLWCVFGFGSALLCCVPVSGGVVRSYVTKCSKPNGSKRFLNSFSS
jgi:hypothetical protein